VAPVSAETVTIASVEPGDGELFHSLRSELGVESFGINLLTLRPAQRLRVHRHERQEEVYLVLEGTLTLLIEGEPVELASGQVARVPASVRRQLTNPSREPVRILALGAYGEHEGRDGVAWADWDEEGDGRHPKDVPLPPDPS
jgi:mannose-6-phosphate isomerase-like protein (cupin superfamily)